MEKSQISLFLTAVSGFAIGSFVLIASLAPTNNASVVSQNSSIESASAATSFLETFNGNLSTPQPWSDANWDVFIHYRDLLLNKSNEVHAHHGMDCSAPMTTSGSLVTHPIRTGEFARQLFLCKDHLMTTIDGGEYGAIYLTPNHMVDFSTGEAVIKFDMSTMRTAGRDWVDLWIVPYQDNLMGPLEDFNPSLQGHPRNGIHIRMGDRGSITPFGTIFTASIIQNFNRTDLPLTGNKYLEEILKTDPARRDTFELRVTKNRIKFWMPGYNYTWIDAALPQQLAWGQGIVQLGHHSYNPFKDCGEANHQAFAPCGPDTWHWDNVSISPSKPFTIIKSNEYWGDLSNSNVVKMNFATPAPSNAHLRFMGKVETNARLEYSIDQGKTWTTAVKQASQRSDTTLQTYFYPVPQGTNSVWFRNVGNWNPNYPPNVVDVSFWSLNTPNTTVTPTPATKTGDINSDGAVNVFDLAILSGNYNKKPSTDPNNELLRASDLTGDDLVSVLDLGVLVGQYR